MTRRIRRLPVRLFRMLQISVSSHGIRSPLKPRILSRVSIDFFAYTKYFIELLEKNRQKRPSLEETLQH